MNKEIIQMKINDLAREKRFATPERIEQINRLITRWQWIISDIDRTEDRGWRSREKI
jgi:hypothetical protein